MNQRNKTPFPFLERFQKTKYDYPEKSIIHHEQVKPYQKYSRGLLIIEIK